MAELDDNTLDNAGTFGRALADTLSEKVTEAIGGMPDSDGKQQAAIARIVGNSLYDYAEEVERHG